MYAATCVCIESPDEDEGDMWHEGSQLGAQTYMTRDIITLSLMREVVSDEGGNIHRDWLRGGHGQYTMYILHVS